MSFVLLPESPIACRNLVGGECAVAQTVVENARAGMVTRKWSARTDGSWMS